MHYKMRLIKRRSIASLIFLFLLSTTHLFSYNSQSETSSSNYKPLRTFPLTAMKVKVGFYVQNIYGLEPAANTYYMDFYIWFIWKGNINPTEKIEFMNGVEDWGLTKVNVYEEPKKLPDGSSYQVIRVEGRFRGDFEFEKYPLDAQSLGVTIENSEYSVNEVVYYADSLQSGYDGGLSIPGWEFENYHMSNLSHAYKSNFGDPTVNEKNSDYSALKFELIVKRPLNYFIWKLLLPLIIVLLSSWGALFLDPTRVDSRILMPITALLTVVFLQQSYSDALPAVSHLVLLDKIYVVAYVLIIAAIGETIYTSRIIKDSNPESIKKVKKIDKWFLLIKALFLVLSVSIIILT